MGSVANFWPMGIMAFLGTEGPTWVRWPPFFFLFREYGPFLGMVAILGMVGHVWAVWPVLIM